VASLSELIFSSKADAGWPRCGFMRMSSGPSSFTEKPRAGSSICMEETPRSARIKSAPAISFSRSEHLRQPGEVAAMRGENFRTETERAKPGLGLGQFNRIGVEAEQFSAG
jgi:hypothetical protein